jgi:hypothetical protein
MDIGRRILSRGHIALTARMQSNSELLQRLDGHIFARGLAMPQQAANLLRPVAPEGFEISAASGFVFTRRRTDCRVGLML